MNDTTIILLALPLIILPYILLFIIIYYANKKDKDEITKIDKELENKMIKALIKSMTPKTKKEKENKK